MNVTWARTLLTALLGCITILSGCAIDPSSIPIPGATVSGPTYRIHVEFTSALNLPAKAAVIANGVKIGNLAGVRIVDQSGTRPGYVVADVDISSKVQLPAKTTAELRQTTILGDIFIALITPPNGFGDLLAPDATIPLSQTVPPLQLEDMLAGIATFVGNGSITQVQDIMNRVNSAMPRDVKDTARISNVLGGDFANLARNLDQVSAFGTSVRSDIDIMEQDGDQIRKLLTQDAATHVTSASIALAKVLSVLGSIGQLAHSIEWLSPLLSASDAAARAFVPLLMTTEPYDARSPTNLAALISLLETKVLPWVEQGPKVDIARVGVARSGSDNAAQPRAETASQIVDVLRMIGAVR